MDRSSKRIAVISWGVKLGEESRGYTRFLSIAEILRQAGYEVDLITSTFQHWDKSKRDVDSFPFHMHDFGIVFINEPGYSRNVDPMRIWSHSRAAKHLTSYLQNSAPDYDLIYCEIPPNDVALAAAEYAHSHGIPFIGDINDLWPEAMRMVLDVPLVSDALFSTLTRDQRKVYSMLDAVVGTSDEYARRPFTDCNQNIENLTVYVGNDIDAFDAGVAEFAPTIDKPDGEFWVTYAGTLGKSYDIQTLIDASVEIKTKGLKQIKILILGDGPDAESLRDYASKVNCNVEFLGYTPYPKMCAYLSKSDVTVNSLVRKAPQSIVTKIGDYLAAGIPMINTGASREFRTKVENDGFGMNVNPENSRDLAKTIEALYRDEDLRHKMGEAAHRIAIEQFDRAHSYQAIVKLVDRQIDPDMR